MDCYAPPKGNIYFFNKLQRNGYVAVYYAQANRWSLPSQNFFVVF